MKCSVEELRYSGPTTVENALRILFFPNYPSDMLALVIIKKNDMNGETLYDGQVRPLFMEKEFHHLLKLPCKGWIPNIPPDHVIKTIFVA